ncbi:MAG: hypothetical protein JJE42_02170, partial [Burkholderiales bacterium]|nr:hypothetical protein [Burkholderiales bacterium]
MREGPLTIGMVAGEASGDLLGAHLIAALRAQLPDARFVGIGGPKMQTQGLNSLFPMERLAVRGYAEVLRHYPGLLWMRHKLKLALLKVQPQLFIGVDAPDFNLGLEAGLKRAGVPVVFGPNMNQEGAGSLLKHGAALQVKDAEELTARLKKLLDSPERRRTM